MMENVFNGVFGRIGKGMCRLSMSGKIAVKTGGGYKSYDVKTGKLTNCSSFVFPETDDFFFLIPTNKVEKGDIILVGGKPKCVIEAEKNKITVLNYEDSTIDTVVPERHVFLGNTYFYGKIVSMFGDASALSGKDGTSKIMKYIMMSSLLGGGNGFNNTNNLLPLMMMSNGSFDLFDGVTDLFGGEEDESEEDSSEKE